MMDATGKPLSYRDAGVDRDVAERAKNSIRRLVDSTRIPGVLSEVGSFGGMFRMVTTCPNCRGRGSVVRDHCPSCGGTGRQLRKRVVTVRMRRRRSKTASTVESFVPVSYANSSVAFVVSSAHARDPRTFAIHPSSRAFPGNVYSGLRASVQARIFNHQEESLWRRRR